MWFSIIFCCFFFLMLFHFDKNKQSLVSWTFPLLWKFFQCSSKLWKERHFEQKSQCGIVCSSWFSTTKKIPFSESSSSKNAPRRGGGGSAAHSGSKWLKPAKNKFTQSDFTSFSIQIVKSLQEQVWPVIFTNFLNLIFGGNFEFDPTVRRSLKRKPVASI